MIKNTSQSQGQSSQQDESKQSSNQTQKSSSNQTTSHSSSNNNHSSISDSALDTILDEYSEDAKKTQSNYEQKSKHQKNISQSSQNNNPQLPTEDELKHKSKPVQSFENDIKNLIRVQQVYSNKYHKLKMAKCQTITLMW